MGSYRSDRVMLTLQEGPPDAEKKAAGSAIVRNEPGPEALLLEQLPGGLREVAHALSTQLGYSVCTVAMGGSPPFPDSVQRSIRWVVADLRTPLARKTCSALEQLRTQTTAAWVGLLPLQESVSPVLPILDMFDEVLFTPIRPTELENRLCLAESRGFRRPPQPVLTSPMGPPRRRELGNYLLISQGNAAHIPMLSIDDDTKAVYLRGTSLRLSPREYQLLWVLAARPGRVFSCEELLRAVWVEDRSATEDYVHQYMYRLRKKLEARAGQPGLLSNIRGFGYRLEQEPAPLPDLSALPWIDPDSLLL